MILRTRGGSRAAAPPFAALAAALAAALLAAGCATQGEVAGGACPAPAFCPVCPVCPAIPPAPEVPAPKAALFEPAAFADLPGWADDALDGVSTALRASCARLARREEWRGPCAELAAISEPAALRAFIESRLTPWRIAAADGRIEGLVTGYYEPLLRGSRVRKGSYRFPLYATPEDLLVIDLAAVNPQLRNLRLRGRLQGRQVVPYFSRAEIENGAAPLTGREIVWVDDALEAFFLQVQGSGRVQLDTGEMLRLGYADQNGHPYVSIGRTLIERGELAPGAASMQAIQAWARANPLRAGELLNQNPSYVFFRELPAGDPALGPAGALGVPLTPRRSVAVDPRYLPLGAPLYLATSYPASDAPLERLVLAQDTGGAIRGEVRADFFWGFGAEAGALAGRMQQRGRMWLLWPRGLTPPAP